MNGSPHIAATHFAKTEAQPSIATRLFIALTTSLVFCVIIASPTSGQAPRSMSFQGYLTNSVGTAINGPQTLTLKLFDAATTGTQIWARTYTGVGVEDGVFNVTLKDGSPSFHGINFVDSLWMEVAVAPDVLSPRTQLRASPYAMGLSLPISAEGNIVGDNASALKVFNTAASGFNYAIYGKNSSNSGYGVYGNATANSGATRGVHGHSLSPVGYGVYGYASHSSGQNYGVYGVSASSSGYGVYGKTYTATGWSGYFDGGQGTYTISADNNAPDLVLGGSSSGSDDGIIGTDAAYASSDLWLYSNDAVVIKLNFDGSTEVSDFEIRNSSNVNIFNVDDSGSVTSAGTANHGSDRNRKDDIVAIDPSEILDEVVRLPISRWRYKEESVPHVGPMAQDFYSSFGVGADDKHIATVDADGVALAAIQSLYELVKEQQAEIERLKQIVEGD